MANSLKASLVACVTSRMVRSRFILSIFIVRTLSRNSQTSLRVSLHISPIELKLLHIPRRHSRSSWQSSAFPTDLASFNAASISALSDLCSLVRIGFVGSLFAFPAPKQTPSFCNAIPGCKSNQPSWHGASLNASVAWATAWPMWGNSAITSTVASRGSFSHNRAISSRVSPHAR